MSEISFGNLHDVNPWEQEPPTKGLGNLGPQEVYPDRIWNGMSPEIGFCQFVVELIHELQWQHDRGMTIVESGIGQGFVTRRVLDALRPEIDVYVGYDMDQYFLDLIPERVFDRGDFRVGTPTLYIEEADLLILDSDMDVRPQELKDWIGNGKSGSHLVIHDTPEMMSPSPPLVNQIARSGFPGHYTTNYRGGWHGIHP